MANYSTFTGNQAALDAALRGARWVIANRALPGGGFRHGVDDRAGPYLADTMAMGQAAIDLYSATGDRSWLTIAGNAGDFIAAKFTGESGYVTSASGETSSGPLSKPAFVVEENIDAARFFNNLSRYLGKDADRQRAGHAMRALASATVVNSPRFLAGALVADQELAIEPVHLTLVGHHGDKAAQDLHAAAAAYPASYRRLDWWDTREGPLPNPDVQYPDMGEAAIFACSNQICSQPIFKADQIDKVVKAMTALRVTARE